MNTKTALRTLCATAALSAACHALAADPATDTVITPLLERPLAARETPVASMLTVEYQPGAGTPPHTHPADTFVYVLAGAIEMQVAGGELKVLKAGDTYYEKPTDTHTVSRNASQTEPAKFLVVFVKDAGAPVLEPVAEH
ncbi:MAG: cupin domain-containing protein [Gammaproteobacteria bacterium]